MLVSYSYMDTPIGRLLLAETERGLCRTGLPNESWTSFLAWLDKVADGAVPHEDPARLAPVIVQLREYFSRLRRAFDLPLDLRGTEFQRAVWSELLAVPYGTTVSYGEISRRIGRGPGGGRAVGAAVGANPVPIIVPCHRVIGADGSMTGYSGGLDIKVALLKLEGVRLQNSAKR